MSTPLRVIAFCGSLRTGSLNRALLRAAIEQAPAHLQVLVWDRLGDLPPYNADLDVDPYPEPVVALRAALTQSDAVLYASPEYNYSIPGALKNLIDWGSRPLPTPAIKRLPSAVIGLSTGISGSMRMQYHLRQVAVFLDSPMMLQPEVIIPKAADRFDASGTLTDPSTRELLTRFMTAFAAWIRQHPRT